MDCNELPRVSIIILNWNGWKDTIECLESVYQSCYPNYNVIVVDNHSEDDSIKRIKDYCAGKIKVKSDFFRYDPKNKPIKVYEYKNNELKSLKSEKRTFQCTSRNKALEIIKNKKNYGFAKGNNIGINYAITTQSPDYILLLNNDTVIDKSSLLNLVKAGETNEKIGVIGSKVYYYNQNKEHNIIHSAGGKIRFTKYPGYYPINNGLKDIKEGINSIYECDWVTGAAMMLKIKKPILLNTKFFFGCEDLDLCIRLKKEGYTIVVSPESKIWHKIGNSREKMYHNLEKGIFEVLDGRTASVKTNLKFLKMHNDKFYLFLPLYFPKIFKEYLIDILLKLRYKLKKKN